MHFAVISLLNILGDITPAAPPGAQAKIDTVTSWVAWFVFALAVIGVLSVAGKMMIDHGRGSGGNHTSSLGYVLGGCMLAALASGITGALV